MIYKDFRSIFNDKKKTVGRYNCINLLFLIWCGRRDLNPHESLHWNLKPARLPIPPRPHIKFEASFSEASIIIAQYILIVKRKILFCFFAVNFSELLDCRCKVLDCAVNHAGIAHIYACNHKAVKGGLGAAALEEVDVLANVCLALGFDTLTIALAAEIQVAYL